MDSNQSKAQSLVLHPSESLAVELKSWIDPEEPEAAAKIVRCALALRNYGGGYLVIGFDNKTHLPEGSPFPDTRAKFHVDKIQGLIAKYASDLFEIAVELPERNGQPHPVIVVPPGIKTPVAARAALVVPGQKKGINVGDVYVRSLRANNTASTTLATWRDWSHIFDVCFENREADIGRFLRRYLSPTSPEAAESISAALRDIYKPALTQEERLLALLDQGNQRFAALTSGRGLPDLGAWEVALEVTGAVPEHHADDAFFNLLASNNPSLTSWPVWLDSRGFIEASERPYVYQGAWEALIVDIDSEWPSGIDFMRFDPKGRFYARRGLEDDTYRGPNAPAPGKVLDVYLPGKRCAEAMIVGISFANAMGCSGPDSLLTFAFRWTGIDGRRLATWSRPGTGFGAHRTARDKGITSFVSLSAETPSSALAPFILDATRPLLESFGGYSVSLNWAEQLLRELLDRRAG